MAAPEGNTNAVKWSDDDVIKSLEKSLQAAISDTNVLCYYDAIQKGDIPYRTIEFYLSKEQQVVLQSIKKEIMAAIASRINKGALSGDYVPAPAIWRMKQLGESDKQEIKHTGDADNPVTFKSIKFGE
jgi:hypothetical protein